MPFQGDVIWDEAEKTDRIILEGNLKCLKTFSYSCKFRGGDSGGGPSSK